MYKPNELTKKLSILKIHILILDYPKKIVHVYPLGSGFWQFCQKKY
jgi:hypothetical protein